MGPRHRGHCIVRLSISRPAEVVPVLVYSSRVRRAIGSDLATRLFGSEPAHALVLLRAAWPLAVGPELARRTEVIALEGSTLRIGVPDPGWRKGLLDMQAEILGSLRRVAGDLAPRRLAFKDGCAPRPADPRPAPPAAPAPQAPAAVAAAAQGIEDPEIRARFLETAARYLALDRRG